MYPCLKDCKVCTNNKTCSGCSQGLYLYNETFCELCSNTILNCRECSFDGKIKCISCAEGYFLENNSITGYESCVCNVKNCFSCKNNQSHCEICLENFGLSSNQSECLPCPSNCKYCVFANYEMLCTICSNNFLLNLTTGSCVQQTDQIAIESLNLGCNSVLVLNNKIYCQSCNEFGKIPSYLGLCISCGTYCERCYEKYEIHNITNYLMNIPLLLIELLTNNTILSSIQNVCSFCSSQADLVGGTCCFIQDENCEKCSKCSVKQICERCSKCHQFLNETNYWMAAFDFKNVYYFQNVYQKLFSSLLNSLNVNYFSKILNSFQNTSLVLFDQIDINMCVPCQIGIRGDCTQSSIYQPDFYFEKISFKSHLLTYYTANLQIDKCKVGFVPVNENGDYHCKYCPEGWEDCTAFKVVMINFTKNSGKFNGLSYEQDINTINDLFTELINNEFINIMNELYVEDLKISIYLETGIIHNFTSNSNRLDITSLFMDNIISLKNFSVEFKPLNYELDQSAFAEIFLDKSFIFSGITYFAFYNIKFAYKEQINFPPLIKNSAYIDAFSVAAGISIQSVYTILLNCSFYSYEDNLNGVGLIVIKSDYVYFTNITWNVKKKNCFSNFLNQELTQINYFDIESTKEVIVSNLNIMFSDMFEEKINLNDSRQGKINLFQIKGDQITFDNIHLLNFSFTYDYFILITSSISFIFNNSKIQNCYFRNFSFLASSQSKNVNIENLTMLNVSFNNLNKVDESLFSGICISLINITIEQSFFNDTILAKSDVSSCANTALFSSIMIYNNSFLYTENAKSFIFLHARTFVKASLIKIINNTDLGSENKKFFLFNFEDVSSISVDNVLIMNTQLFLGLFYFWANRIVISNFKIINDQIIKIFSQIAIKIYSCPESFKLNDSYFKNMYNNHNGIISIFTKDIAEITKYIDINNVHISNIYLEALNIETTSIFYIISIIQNEISLNSCTFKNIYLNDSSVYQQSSSFFTLSSFISNVKISNLSTFNLSSIGNKNLIYALTNSIEIRNSNFTYLNYYYPVHFLKNTLNSFGSFAFLSFMNDSQVYDCIFSNIFGTIGGVFYIKDINSNNFSISRCNFENISVINQGGILYSEYYEKSPTFNIFIVNSKFNHIEAWLKGGVFYVIGMNNTYILLLNCNITYIDAIESSFLYGSSISFFMSNSNIQYNKKLISPLNDSYGNYMGIEQNSFVYLIKSWMIMENSNLSNFISNNVFSPLFYIKEGEIIIISVKITEIIFSNAIFFTTTSNFSILSSNLFNCSTPLEITLHHTWNYHLSPLIYQLESSFKMLNSFVKNINCSFCSFGGSFLYLNGEAIITNTSFSECFSYLGGVLRINANFYLNLSYNSSLILSQSNFFNCSAVTSAGCIVIISTKGNIFINKSYFEGCSTNENGGALEFSEDLSSLFNEYNLFLNSTTFKNNKANIGGAIFYQDKQIIIENCTFINNTAIYYGNNTYSYPRKISLKNMNESKIIVENNVLKYENFRSGDIIPTLKFQILDEEDKPINYIDNSMNLANPHLSISIESLSNNSIFSINNKKEINNIKMEKDGNFIISNLELIANPNSTVILKISSDNIRKTNGDSQLKSKIYYFSILVYVRPCNLGEIYKSQNGICSPCIHGEEYSFNITDPLCKKCLKGLNCSNPGAPSINPGYWRNNILSENIVECDNNPFSCKGGALYGNYICREGYIGAKCESCDIKQIVSSTSYSKNGLYECLACKSSILNYVFFGITAILNFFLMAMAVKGTLNSIQIHLKKKVIRAIAPYSLMPFRNQSETSIYVKIYLSYFQIIQVLSNLKISVPTFFNSVTVSVGNPVFYISNATDCILIQGMELSFPYIYLKLILVLIVPVLYILIFTVGYFLRTYSLRIQKLRKFYLLYSVCLFSLFFFQPAVIRYVIKILTCVEISNETYIKFDVAFRCDTDDYNLYSVLLALPALIIWGFIIPLFLLWRIHVNREFLNEVNIKLKYGYLYQEYKIYFWEFIRMYEKLLIIIFLEFYETQMVYKVLLVLIVIAVYFVLGDKYKPYLLKNQNKIDKLTTIVCFLSIFCGLLIYVNPLIYVEVIAWGIIFILNVFYNTLMIKLIFGYYANIIVGILSKFAFFSKYFKKNPGNTRILDMWKNARRLVSKYLREKIRRKRVASIISARNSFFKLEMEDYDPNCVGAKRIKKLKKRKIQILDDHDRCDSQDSARPLTKKPKQKKNKLLAFLNEALENLRFDEGIN